MATPSMCGIQQDVDDDLFAAHKAYRAAQYDIPSTPLHSATQLCALREEKKMKKCGEKNSTAQY